MRHQHRKTRESRNEPGQAHFLTFSTFHRYPLLVSDRLRNWIVDAMQDLRRSQDVALWAYVIMPEHVHVLLCPRKADYQMRRILAGLKHPVSKKAHAYLEVTNNTDWIQRLSVARRTQGGEKKSVFRLWQPGGGFDKNISVYDDLDQITTYLHANPVRRELCDKSTDWEWSSAKFWEGEPGSRLDMDHPSDFQTADG